MLPVCRSLLPNHIRLKKGYSERQDPIISTKLADSPDNLSTFAGNYTKDKMLQAGNYQTLTISRISDHGLYLADEEGAEVLLPNRYVSLHDKPGDAKEVFLYHDSEDRLVATTERPLAVVGETAYLKVVDKTIHGAFLDWGLQGKDLFVPNRNQDVPMQAGKSYVVYLYRDNVTGRTVASARLNGFISNEAMALRPRQQVSIRIASETPLGYRVVIEDRHWGMLYRNQLFRPVAIGEKTAAYVRKITPDNRVDVSLQQEGFDEVRRSAERLLEIIRHAGGTIPLGDDSSPEMIATAIHMSKKVFKRSLGYLLKRGDVETNGTTTRLTNKR